MFNMFFEDAKCPGSQHSTPCLACFNVFPALTHPDHLTMGC